MGFKATVFSDLFLLPYFLDHVTPKNWASVEYLHNEITKQSQNCNYRGKLMFLKFLTLT